MLSWHLMEATLRLSHRATYADYLAAEHNSNCRHEFLDGVIVAMAGGSDEHNAIAGLVARALLNRVTGNFRYYTADQPVLDRRARAESVCRRPRIICGAPEHPPHDDQATTNPVVIVEVLSPSKRRGRSR